MLALEPGAEAVEVEDVGAAQPLVAPPRRQLLPADDADVVGARALFRGRVWKAGIHVGCDAAVAQEVSHPGLEVAEGPVEVAQLWMEGVGVRGAGERGGAQESETGACEPK